MSKLVVKKVKCGSLLTESSLPDSDYVINPYIGCSHGCVYCYAQFMKRFTGHSGEKWGTFIDVKEGGVLDTRGVTGNMLISSVTDPYNVCEEKYEKTRYVLEELVKQKPKCHIEILTKSPLVVRDIDLLKKIPDLRVGLSISSLNYSLFTKYTEPHASDPKDRAKAIKMLHDNGIKTWVFASPIFPIIEGWKDVVDEVGSNTDFFGFENLNLRANYKSDVFELIKNRFPKIYNQFTELYNDPVALRNYWIDARNRIQSYMNKKKLKSIIYFFHEEIRK